MTGPLCRIRILCKPWLQPRETTRSGVGTPVGSTGPQKPGNLLFRLRAMKSRFLIRRGGLGMAISSVLIIAAAFLFAPAPAWAWGANAQRLIATRSIDTLPPEIRAFFDTNREFLLRHVTDPLTALEATPKTEAPNQMLHLDHYGPFPFSELPREYRAALAKFGRPKLETAGLLPWQIGLVSQHLTDAMRAGNWEQVKQQAALLAGYVAQAHDPFNTTEDFDGHIAGQPGVNLRFSTNLVERYSLFFPMHPNDAAYILDPTDHAFESCLNAHSWLENILLADRRAHAGLSDYTDDYYDRFYNQAGATLIRQLSDAATDIGSYWLTSWVNAGKPALPRQ
jgi:hypothetical protein